VAAQVKSSVGAAVSVGQHAPHPVGHHLVDAARQAFISGSDHAMLVAVAAAILGSLVAARYLPSRPQGEVVPAGAEVTDMEETGRLELSAA
jgi:hypothetical protein